MKGVRVGVLMGGWSAERPVSLVSGKACADAARALGADVVEIDVDHSIAQVLKSVSPDVALNALHGPWGEDGRIQSVLEIANIPYTHSGVLASALAMDKQKAKTFFASAGLDVPLGTIMDRHEAAENHPLEPPYVVKPNADGSSFGVFIVRAGENRPPEMLLDAQWRSGDTVLVEEFIPGRELTVAVMGGQALAVTEIRTGHAFYDYEAKYAAGGSIHHLNPSDLPSVIKAKAMEQAVQAHQLLGCGGVTRTDFRYDPETNRLVVLELNTQPGMTPTSLAPEQAAHAGIGFNDLVKWMLEDASCPR
ncbi:D-alanine--D-alanine ligase [Candidatus Phycosocius spiralis]|uniref:D-alanine--D-alanine ligase n=1 Tax=Candidatus Phycosocius spiralis TaxID=2815099 RepID=A0ABQ4PV88_9PROT|nr:D-alanine--D-alanine ligase [Candidatus Phycosocius spiralis]GIU66898.1 D-alanine--D-alanine ligase [Candidatus Phycosocius spiralis]